MKIILLDSLLSTDEEVPVFNIKTCPTLKTLLRGQVSQQEALANVWQYILPEPLWPGIAPLTLVCDMPHAAAGFWLRADPVFLQPTLNNLILFSNESLFITQAEADALIQSLNHLFAENGLTFHAPTPYHWYVHCKTAPKVCFANITSVLRRQIDGFLPSGTESLTWHRYLNEIQMLFYTHPVNEARALANQPLISSVWFWGGGNSPVNQPHDRASHIYSDQEEICQQARALGYAAEKLTGDLLPACRHDSVWIVQSLSQALEASGKTGWQQAFIDVEKTYLHTTFTALKKRQITQIELLLTNDNTVYHVLTRRTDCWKIWRSTPTLWKK